ncbi:centromere protein X isoform X2 [Sus scrofa]|nr:centromere protein X isoform X2 [Sus scrofa]
MEESGTGFRKELVSKLLHLHFKDDKTKVSGDALQLTAELLKVFVVEAAVRSVRQAQAEDLTRVDVDQLEKVLDRPASQQSAPPHVMLCLDAADGGLSGNPAHGGWRLGGALPYAPPGAAEHPLGGRSTRRRSGPPANRPSVLHTQAESWGAATSVQAGLSPSSHLTLLRRCSPELCVCSHRAASVNQSRLSRHSLLPFIPPEPGCFQVGGRGGAGDAQQV